MKTLLSATYEMKQKIEELELKEKLTLEEKAILKNLFSNIVLSVNSEPYISEETIRETHSYYYSKLNELLLKEEEIIIPPEPEQHEPEPEVISDLKEEVKTTKQKRQAKK